ncbi:hypothetical protein RQP46_007227 [Phenoliferia psychrophenolica]
MKEHSVQAYIVPSDDQHASEYVAEADKRREWISGFTGSAGTAVVLLEEAFLTTDGRYHLPISPNAQQASKELSSEWTLQRYGLPGSLNLRGSDIDFNPIFFGYLVIPVSSPPTVFVNIDQLPQATYAYLESNGVLIEPYDDVVKYLEGVGKGLKAEDRVIVPSRTNLALSQALGLDKLDICRGPIGDLKAVKNETELEGFRQCHIRDGVALTRYFAWLEAQLHSGARITESEGSDKLEALRSELPLFKGLSFTTISSTGANASVIHYQPHPTDSAVIDPEAIYLCDSGAQFLDGTTDTTRTWHFGTPKDEEVRAATRVLQGKLLPSSPSHLFICADWDETTGHIAIDELVFPSTTTGYLIDAFARRALWQDGLDYRHGTGHGVGSFLNVHEGPHGIGTRVAYNDVKLKAGFTVSNEPGYYQDGAFGIRIENVVAVKTVQPRNDFGGVGWLGFERFTMVPISTKLVDPALMSKSDVKWLNEYNAEVREKLHELVKATGDEVALAWLERETRPLVAV